MNRLHRAAFSSWLPRHSLALSLAFAALLAACDDGGGDPAEDMIEDVQDTTDTVVPDTGDPTDVDTAEPPDTTDVDTSDGDATDADATDTADAGDGEDTDVAETAVCGNDTLESGEACDGSDLGTETCVTQGFVGGTLACATDCSGFDTTGCVVEDCGDGMATGNESCDGADLNNQSCGSIGEGSGTLACAANCTFDTTGCSGSTPVCGDGAITGTEVCDGAELDGQDCAARGYTGGTLGCLSDCSGFDESGCSVCGDDTLGAGEVCDGSDLGTETCQTQGFVGGTLACATDCSGFDTTGCNSCGDGTIDTGEVCDGAALGGATCQSEGFDTGSLSCAADCTLDTSACSTFGCGNGTLDPGEACEGLDVDGATCTGEGFDGGVVVCASNCTLDTSNCYECGDNAIGGPEVCDGTALAGETCQKRGFFGGTLRCNATCDDYDETSCVPTPVCGNNLREIGEFCDGTDVSGVRCTNLGFLGGTLVCAAGCGGYDTSGCVTCDPDPREDDDTAMTATPVMPGATLTDGTLCSGDPDWFELVLNEGDTGTIDLDFVHADGDLELELYRPDGMLAASSLSGTDNESVSFSVGVGMSGAWRVRVFGFNNAANDYTIDFDVTPFLLACPGDDIYEENDDQPRGTPLVADRSYNGILCNADLDWFSIELGEGDQVTFDLLFDDAMGDMDLFLYLQGPTPVASSTTNDDNEQILDYVVPVGQAGRYGVLVRRATPGAGMFANTYSLSVDRIPGSVCGDGVIEGSETCDGSNFGGQTCVDYGFVSGVLQCDANCQTVTTGCSSTLACPDDDSYEDNDSLATATPTAGQTIFNGILCGSDLDFFSIPLSAGQTLTADLFFTHADGNLGLILYNSLNGAVASVNTSTDNEQLVYTVPATASSPYRLRITGPSSASTPYTLQLTITP